MSRKRTTCMEDFFRVENRSSGVTQEKKRNISGSSGSADVPPVSHSNSLMSLGSELEADSRSGSQAIDSTSHTL